jgi:hypothetical protein
MKPDLHGEEQDSTLLAYWLDELGEEQAAEVEEHMFNCEACSARLRELLVLRESVRQALLDSQFLTIVTGGFIRRLQESGERIRQYRLEAGGSVLCTVAPDDHLVASHLRAPLEGVRQVDFEFDGVDGEYRAVHVPFDAANNEVSFIPSMAMVRSLGVDTSRVRLLAVNLGSERVIAEYTFNHRPWSADKL